MKMGRKSALLTRTTTVSGKKTMIQVIHFKTSMFDLSKEDVNPINPIYGISLLEWLSNELNGELEITEPEAEDWGWYSELEYEGNNYLIGA
jgi:hypothetical protein